MSSIQIMDMCLLLDHPLFSLGQLTPKKLLNVLSLMRSTKFNNLSSVCPLVARVLLHIKIANVVAEQLNHGRWTKRMTEGLD